MGDHRMNAAPGWYDDPYTPGQLRWWDGQAWTHHTHAAVANPSAGNAIFDELAQARNELERIRAELVEARDYMLLQEVGLYEYAHPLESSVKYREALKNLRAELKAAVKSAGAVVGTKKWAINGSLADGQRMVGDLSKLLLRAYNLEAEAVVKNLKPFELKSAIARLDKTRQTIARLGKSMSIEITDLYHALRVKELELTADFRAMLAAEKEREREERERLRDEAAAKAEFEREQARLEKELNHYRNALVGLRQQGDQRAIETAEAKVAELGLALRGIVERAANIRAGYVYVISNFGAFGPGVVKIGMTRRLEPMDRVHELGDASVPFRFDVHAMVFSEDARGVERDLHERFADKRLNLINLRREFFYVTPREVEAALIDLRGDLVSFNEEAEAAEWNQSNLVRRQRGLDVIPPPG